MSFWYPYHAPTGCLVPRHQPPDDMPEIGFLQREGMASLRLFGRPDPCSRGWQYSYISAGGQRLQLYARRDNPLYSGEFVSLPDRPDLGTFTVNLHQVSGCGRFG